MKKEKVICVRGNWGVILCLPKGEPFTDERICIEIGRLKRLGLKPYTREYYLNKIKK